MKPDRKLSQDLARFAIRWHCLGLDYLACMQRLKKWSYIYGIASAWNLYMIVWSLWDGDLFVAGVSMVITTWFFTCAIVDIDRILDLAKGAQDCKNYSEVDIASIGLTAIEILHNKEQEQKNDA